ncbi:MAG: HPr family phosphocarrier protein [Candidatus Glassbacteria bacterium]
MAANTVTVRNKLGLHARPAALFVQLANRFKSDIFINKNGVEVNGKSIMSVMMLAVESGSEIIIRAVGEDAEDAVNALSALIESGFDEE